MASKTRRQEVETVRTQDIRMPDLKLPATKLPEVDLPEMSLPDIRVPEVKTPDLKLRERLGDVHMPDDVRSAARDAAQWPRRAWQQRQRARQAANWRGRGIGLTTIALAALGGWAVAYFWDPQRGKGRRIQTADRLAAMARRTGDQVGRVSRYVGSTASAKTHAWIRPRGRYVAPNDAALAAKVESELFRDPSIDKGRINVNVENGVVVLRGEADDEDRIQHIVAAVNTIPGVKSVQDLLRVPGQAATDVMGHPIAAGPDSVNPGL